jgi:hypothetical protein
MDIPGLNRNNIKNLNLKKLQEYLETVKVKKVNAYIFPLSFKVDVDLIRSDGHHFAGSGSSSVCISTKSNAKTIFFPENFNLMSKT